MATDLSDALYVWLTTSADAAAYRALVFSFKEAGFVDPKLLTDQQIARRAASSSQILVASIQDAGDYPIPVRNEKATVVIRHYDREYGYKNLRVARDMLRVVLKDFTTVLDSVAGFSRGVIELNYAGRTGHRRDITANCDWEAITYVGTVIVED